jgi:hypothetical protein
MKSLSTTALIKMGPRLKSRHEGRVRLGYKPMADGIAAISIRLPTDAQWIYDGAIFNAMGRIGFHTM